MRPETTWRLAIVGAVTLISMWLIWPTFHYFIAASGRIKTTPEQLTEMRKKSVPLGLDLQGGVDVLLAIDTEKTRQNKMDQLADSLRTNAFQRESPPIDAKVEVTSGSQQIVVTLNKPEQERSADNILLRWKEDGTFSDYEAGSIKAGQPLALQPARIVLEQDLEKTVESSLKVIRDRVDKLGVTQPVVVRQGQDRIRVQVPGEKDPQSVVRNIIRPAKLEFRGVHVDQSSRDAESRVSEDSHNFINTKDGKPLPGKQIPPNYEVRKMSEQKSDPRTGQITSTERHLLVKKRPEMTGAMLKDAWVTINQASFQSPVVVSLLFSREGAKRFEQVTKEYLNKPLAIMLDDVVYSAPNVRSVISEGSAQIEGAFTQEEAKNLSLVLKAGALPAEMVTREQRTVEATLGADSIKSSVTALIIGSILIAIFMVMYYGVAGFIADIAVLINVLLIFAFMKLANATLTLSGIGGILLTVGMAVDANVLIYERIREELKSGKSMKAAISLGFSRAFSVIFDGNLTTLISGLVLLQFGAGSVKGFALALNVGMIANLFTGLFCTKALVDFWFAMHKRLSVGKFQWFPDGFYLDFVGMRKYSYAWSIGLFLVSIAFVTPMWHGSNWGVDFSGGLLTHVQVSKDMTTQQIQGEHHDWRVQKVAGQANGQNQFLIRTKLVDETQAQIPNTQKVVTQRLNETIGDANYSVLGNESVGNEVGNEFTRMAIVASIMACIGILLYMALRFEFAFGFAAVVAIFHDLLIVYGVFNMLGAAGLAGEVTLDVVSALLVILGYSVNDTVIIFDRIRENLKLHPSMPFRELLNHSISESLNRTIVTVGAVMLVLLVLLFFGGAGLYDFALVLLLGVIKGTYSSSFVATPLLYEIHRWQQKKRERAGGESKTIRPMISERA